MVSLFAWIWGNTHEQMDMTNAEYQVFGALGTLGFGIASIIYAITHRHKKGTTG